MSTNPLNDISRVYLEQVASVDEGYKPIDRKKESAMYRRAGNLARTSLSSRGKKKEEAQTKSANIVRAITRQKERERFDRIGQSPSHNEEAKPDYLDFDKDGNKKEPMKKALKDKAKKKNLEEAGGRHGGGSMVGQPGGPPSRDRRTPEQRAADDAAREESIRRSERRAEARFGKRPVQEAKKPNDGNLANNYPPYDKVTRGDVIAGRLGKDEMGGKKKGMKEGFSNWRQELSEVMTDVEDKKKIKEKKIENKIKTSAMGSGIKLGEAIEELGGTLLDIVELDEKLNLKKAEMGEVIKDFYKSKAPQFKGRSKEKRREMAIAAKLTAERGKLGEQMTDAPMDSAAPDPALDKKKEMMDKQKLANLKMLQQKTQQIQQKKLQLQRTGKLPLETASYEPEGEVIDERRREDKGTPRGPEPSAAFKTVSKMMGSGRLGVQPRGVKKDKGASTPGPSMTPAQKVAKRRADAQRAQNMMHSPRD